ncbi:hypothetical protein RRG08_019892 [Elysia crispata]|uniref:Uncharacterized protein n=1 Tax=Elysia crispata TaxID=231223 RepID=A0AAE0Z8K3_9GAST|nr:hypothetical protein RRG08_019892 [Elysia crispata]
MLQESCNLENVGGEFDPTRPISLWCARKDDVHRSTPSDLALVRPRVIEALGRDWEISFSSHSVRHIKMWD